MKIEHLEQLVRIVEEGSMNEAAKKLYTAHSSLSNAMKNLESELGAPIFSRTNKGVRLTPFGADVYEQAREICGRVDSLKKNAVARAASRLSVSSLYCSLANEAFSELYRRHYQETFDAAIEEVTLSEILHRVSSGFSEIGIATLFPSNEEATLRSAADLELEFHEVIRRNMYVIVGPKNPFYTTGRQTIRLEELRAFPNLENYASLVDLSWEKDFSTFGGYRASIRVNDMGLALQLVSETDAFMIDTDDKSAYASLYAENGCRFIPLEEPLVHCALGWIKSAYRRLSPAAEEFLAIFTDLAKRTQD